MIETIIHTFMYTYNIVLSSIAIAIAMDTRCIHTCANIYIQKACQLNSHTHTHALNVRHIRFEKGGGRSERERESENEFAAAITDSNMRYYTNVNMKLLYINVFHVFWLGIVPTLSPSILCM